jgi:hypothetical protein
VKQSLEYLLQQSVPKLVSLCTLEAVMLKIGGRRRPDYLSPLACEGKFSAMQ